MLVLQVYFEYSGILSLTPDFQLSDLINDLASVILSNLEAIEGDENSLRFAKYSNLLDLDGAMFLIKDYEYGLTYKKDNLIYNKSFNYGY